MSIDIYTQQKVYDPANGHHVGTVHKKNGVEYSGSWVVDGKWQDGQELIDKNSHIKSFSDLSSQAGHRYGADGYLKHEDNRPPYEEEQPTSSGGGGGNPNAGFMAGGVGAGPYNPPNSMIQTAIDRADRWRDDAAGSGTPGTIGSDYFDLDETNQSNETKVTQNVGNIGNWTVNNNPVNSDQTYANIGNDYSLNLGYINNNNSNIKV